LANAINIVLGPCLIFGLGPFPRLGVTGAAIATNIGRGTGVLFALSRLLKPGSRVDIHARHLKIEPALIRRLLQLAWSAALQFLIGMGSWIALVRILSTFGSDTLAGYTIGFGSSCSRSPGIGSRERKRRWSVKRWVRASGTRRQAVKIAGEYNMLVRRKSVCCSASAHRVARLFTSTNVAPSRRTCCGLRSGIRYGWGMVYGHRSTGGRHAHADAAEPGRVLMPGDPLAFVLAIPLFRPVGVFLAMALAFSTYAGWFVGVQPGPGRAGSDRSKRRSSLGKDGFSEAPSEKPCFLLRPLGDGRFDSARQRRPPPRARPYALSRPAPALRLLDLSTRSSISAIFSGSFAIRHPPVPSTIILVALRRIEFGRYPSPYVDPSLHPSQPRRALAPFTANRAFKRAPVFVAASGMYYTAADGRQILDGTAGLWCVNAGHCRESITSAIREQAGVMDYAPPFQMGHLLAFELAQQLVAMLPGDLDHVFFSNSGSEAVDTALKIALAYWQAKGEPERVRFVGRARGYHGVGFGGVGVGGIESNRRQFDAELPTDGRPSPQARSRRQRVHARPALRHARAARRRARGDRSQPRRAHDRRGDRRTRRRIDRRSRSPSDTSSGCARSATATASSSFSTESSPIWKNRPAFGATVRRDAGHDDAGQRASPTPPCRWARRLPAARHLRRDRRRRSGRHRALSRLHVFGPPARRGCRSRDARPL
jgi:hypothetical protein